MRYRESGGCLLPGLGSTVREGGRNGLRRQEVGRYGLSQDFAAFVRESSDVR